MTRLIYEVKKVNMDILKAPEGENLLMTAFRSIEESRPTLDHQGNGLEEAYTTLFGNPAQNASPQRQIFERLSLLNQTQAVTIRSSTGA